MEREEYYVRKIVVPLICFSMIISVIAFTNSESDLSFNENNPTPVIKGWTEDEFIVSYDEAGVYDAMAPDIAVAPPGSPWEGSIHTVWAELNNSVDDPYVEIHYSMSEAGERGLEWSNDDAAEEDKLISQDFVNTGGKGFANQGNTSYPSIAIDSMGWIHVVWVESYTDWTYEVHYSRSEDNGKTWTGYDGAGDTLITERTGEDSFWIEQPRIAVTDIPLTLHVVWNEVSPVGEATEAWYAKSSDQGDLWSLPVQVSGLSAVGEPNVLSPDIATGGPGNSVVHVVWTQDIEISPGIWASDIFYSRSPDNGESWEPERTISLPVPDTYAYRARIDAQGDNVHVVWDQSASPLEIYYSGSQDGGFSWSGESEDNNISFPDGNDAMWPVVASYDGPGGPEVHVAWIERDETNFNGTMEIHYSMSDDPLDPLSWTGREGDMVLSYPDTGEFAEANAPAIAVGEIGGKVRPQIVWEELNVAGASKAEGNYEIHYLPDTTYDVPIHLGWNLISCPLIQNDTSILNVLNDSAGDGLTTWDKVRGYTNNGTVTTWTSYFTAKPASLNDLWNIDHKMGIWIYITSLGDGNLTFSGDYGTSTTIDLKAGWNLVGYPAQTSKSITDALGGINDRPVEGYNGSASYLITQLPGTYMMQPGEGYWVHVASDTVWTVDW